VVIGLAALLSLRASFEGEFVHGRLEYTGPADAASSNEFGMLLAAMCPLLLPFLLKGRWYERVFAAAALVLFLHALVMCNSRGALVAFAGAAVYGLYATRGRMRLIVAGACVVAAAATLYLASEYFVQRMSSLWSTNLSSEEAVNDLSTGRVAIFRYGLAMARDHPFGAGPDGFRALSRFYMPAENLTVHPGALYGVRAAHNSYLQVLVEQGILGLLVFLWICVAAFGSLHRAIRTVRETGCADGFLGLTVLGLGMSVVASLVGGVFGAQVYYEFFWWQVALSAVGASIVQDQVGSKMPRTCAAGNVLARV